LTRVTVEPKFEGDFITYKTRAMSGNPGSGKPQTTSINIQVPTREWLAEKRFLIPVCFSLVILLFFFTFCDYRIVGSVGPSRSEANEQTQKSISGFNFITGTALPTSAINNEFISGLSDTKNEQVENQQKVTFNFWALLAFLSALAGVYVYWKKQRDEALYSTAFALIGIIGLFMLLRSVNSYEGKIELGLVIVQTKIVFQFPYWLSLVSFATAGVISYLRLKLKSSATGISTTNAPTPIHVNIITQETDTADKV
jgi:hypothetical protein